MVYSQSLCYFRRFRRQTKIVVRHTKKCCTIKSRQRRRLNVVKETQMKSTSWQKKWIVVMHSDYDNTWSDKTIPSTLMQAIRFMQAKRWNHAMDKGTVRIVTLDEWATLPKYKVAA